MTGYNRTRVGFILFLSLMVFCLSTLFKSYQALAANAPSDIAYNSYATTNATTTAYTTLFASTMRPFSELLVCDTSGHFIKLAIGKAGSELDITSCPVSGCFLIHTGQLIPVGSRISFRAIDATATTGGLVVTGNQ